MLYARFTVVAIALALAFSCQKAPVSGTTDETVLNTATIYNPDLSRAVNATVKVFAAGDTSRIPVYQTSTDSAGKFSLSVPKGVYNVIVGQDSLGAFQDSVIVQGLYSTLANDTLAHQAVLCGLITMQPMHDPRTATVQVLGTDKYSNVQQNGAFIIADLPPGNYSLRAVTTIAEYTPTFATLRVFAQSQDTVRDTIALIYTGIPAIPSLSAVYDTLRGFVTISWDTVDFLLLHDFLIYRDKSPALTPSTIPIGSSSVCRFTDTISQAMADSQTGYVYRVAVRAKNLAVGQTYADVRLTVIPPFTVYRVRDTVPALLGVADTLRAHVTGYRGSHVSFAWDIGNKGVFTISLQPETAVVIHDTVTDNYQCVLKVLVDNATFFIDTMRLTTNFALQKIASPFTDSLRTSGIHTVVLGNKIVALAVLTTPKVSVWQSPDGLNWSKITDSLPFPFSAYTSKPVVFANKMCLIDDSGFLWTSTDAVSWNKASTAPLCNTVEVMGSAFSPAPGTKCPPALFVDGTRILVQSFYGTGLEKILSSTDLVAWDSTSGYQIRQFAFDYAQVNGTLAVIGVDLTNGLDWNPWVFMKNSGTSQYDSLTTLQGTSSSPYAYSLDAFKDVVLLYANGNPFVLARSAALGKQWFACSQVPASAAACSIIVFGNQIFLVTSSGIFRATT